ncbi:adenosine-specific kinase [bacterium]|nr:adenosine-specific kinase [bacterium]
MELEIIKIDNPNGYNFILGQSHFIKTVEDLYEAIVGSVPGIKFGLAFCESSGPRLVRFAGNDEELIELAKKNAYNIGAGHSFIIFIKDAYPINILRAIKDVQEVCNIYCATANPVEVVVAKTDQGKGILGVIDGSSPLGIEGEKEIEERKVFLRKVGYKL